MVFTKSSAGSASSVYSAKPLVRKPTLLSIVNTTDTFISESTTVLPSVTTTVFHTPSHITSITDAIDTKSTTENTTPVNDTNVNNTPAMTTTTTEITLTPIATTNTSTISTASNIGRDDSLKSNTFADTESSSQTQDNSEVRTFASLSISLSSYVNLNIGLSIFVIPK